MEYTGREKWKINIVINSITFLGMALVGLFIIYGIQKHLFTSQAALEGFLHKFGVFSPVIFMVFQAVQAILPIAPGGIGCLGGIIAFGPVKGFIYNYIGICIGSIIAFLISRRYGLSFVQSIAKKKTFNKYVKWLEKPNFEKLFAIAIFMPVAPDDLLCYLAGVSKINLRKFVVIIILGKPFAIAAYSFGLNLVMQYLLPLLK
ncbi:TVP38/TMEM64 family protein [Clostridium zeae]|uniref:TVP38/TMEM64 family membrane protein n=1 Tax=Clostridium zeae TaxID=2759022 RepID=A0ABQ1E5D4_9CLOT|nr:TVP38/TMEM64 family protein [Clostridium zeae]GFZ29960.1 TVP38/TMEM64 family protein [Clostridium zeae]